MRHHRKADRQELTGNQSRALGATPTGWPSSFRMWVNRTAVNPFQQVGRSHGDQPTGRTACGGFGTLCAETSPPDCQVGWDGQKKRPLGSPLARERLPCHLSVR
jgi:hypothetical protein